MKRTITVLGRPRPQGSMRTLIPKRQAKPVTLPSDAGIYKYRADVQATFVRAYGEPAPLEGPVVLHATFFFRRPDNHYLPVAPTKGRKAREALKVTAPVIHHVSTPDVDKLLRAIGDALTGFAYVDDKQICDIWGSKRWADADMSVIDILTVGQDEEDAKNGL